MWIYLPRQISSHYAQGSEELSSDSKWLFLLLEQSCTVRGKCMRVKYWSSAWKKDALTQHLFGQILQPSKADHGVVRWISSLPASPASHGVAQEKEREPRTSAGYGQTSPASLAKYDPRTSSWRTSQVSLAAGGYLEFSETLPKSGTMRSGCIYPRQTSERTTNGNGSGYWPTPRSGERGIRRTKRLMETGHRGRLEDAVALVEMWPTPRANETGGYQRDRGQKGKERPTLSGAIKMWRTPSASDGEGGIKTGPKYWDAKAPKIKLRDQVHWPTPTSRDRKDTGDSVAKGNVPVNSLLGRAVEPTKMKGSLDAEFVEYLMGFPIGWTGLEPVETESFRLWEESHIAYSKNVLESIKCQKNIN